MGTMSFGSRGGGSGMRTGDAGCGGYVSLEGQMINRPYDPNDIKAEVNKLFKKLFVHAPIYIYAMFDNSYLDNVYSELFKLSSLIRNQDSVKIIGEKYNIDMQAPNFIFTLMNKFDEKFKLPEISGECALCVRNALEKFLFKAVDDDPNCVFADGRKVIRTMSKNTQFWKSMSGYFLYFLAITVYKKDVEEKIQIATFMVQNDIERRINQVIYSFEQISNRRKPDYKNIFRYIRQNWDWFKKEMLR